MMYEKRKVDRKQLRSEKSLKRGYLRKLKKKYIYILPDQGE